MQKIGIIKIVPVIVLLSVFFALVFASVITKSPICDEASHHIASGYSYIRLGDFRMNPSTPPLIRLLIGMPLLSMDLKIPTDHPSWQTINSSEFGYQFLYIYNRQVADKIVFLSRLPMAILSTILGLFIFIVGNRLYGYGSGLFSLFLYTFSTTILGNAGLAMLDMGCALFIFLALFQFYRYLVRKTGANLICAGILFGLAQSAKVTSLILYPLLLILALADYAANRKDSPSLWNVIKSLILLWAIGFFVLWASYFFEFKPLLKNAPDVEEKIAYIKKASSLIPFIDSEKTFSSLVHFAKDIPIPLSTYIVSVLGVGRMAIVGDQGVFFMGNHLFAGSRIYYIADYLIKTPLPEIIILIASLLLLKKRKEIGYISNLFIILPIAMFSVIASLSRLQGGLRYILPIYPFLYLFLGGIVTVNFGKFRKVAGLLFIALVMWYGVSSMVVFPDYLAYFNELVGGPNGFGYRITSDADWGQDFKALKRYMDKEGIKNVRLNCFGSADPSFYGIAYKPFTHEDFLRPKEGAYYAISSRNLIAIEWPKTMMPITRVGKTIFVYHIEQKGR